MISVCLSCWARHLVAQLGEQVGERVHGALGAVQLRLQRPQLQLAALALAAAHQRQRAEPREPVQVVGLE